MRTRALALLNLGGTAVALAAGMSAPTLAWADVVINEFLPNPDGTDTGNEYVELYNSGSASVDLSGWVLQAGTSTPSDKFTVPDGISIAPGAFLVLGEELVADADLTTGTLSLGNAGSSGDIVRLLDSGGTVIDTVVYGPNNDDGFLDDTGALAVPGPKPGNGTALGRRPDGSDSDDSSVDFVDMPPSPGASNAPPAPDCDLADVADKVVVNELMPDPEGADAGLEWVELYNNGSATVDLSGWRVEAGTSDYGVVGTLPDGTTLPSRGFLLVGGDQVPSRDGELTGSLPNASSNADSVRIADCVGTPVDTVIYGATNEDGWTEEEEATVAQVQALLGGAVPLSATLVGVPVFSGISAEIVLRPSRRVLPELITRILSDAGVGMPDQAGVRFLPRPRRVEGQAFAQVGRIRSRDEGRVLHLWVSMDNLRAIATAAVGLTGAALRDRIQGGG